MSNYIDERQRRKLAYWARYDDVDNFCPEVEEEDFGILMQEMEAHMGEEQFRNLIMFSACIACLKYISKTGFHVPAAVLHGANHNTEHTEAHAEAVRSVSHIKGGNGHAHKRRML